MWKFASGLQGRLESRLVEGADSAQMTDAAVSLWTDIAAVVAPVIGTLGMAALLRRTLSLSLAAMPSLAIALQDSTSTNVFDGLRKALSMQSGADVARSNEVLLRTFFELLATLIGSALTERLLAYVPDNASSGQPPQEISNE
jgi:hypothetical protein